MHLSSAPSQANIGKQIASGAGRCRERRLQLALGAVWFLTALAVLRLPPLAHAQVQAQPAPARPLVAQPATTASTDPKAIAEQCAAREAALILHPNSFLRYRMHAVDEKGDQIRDMIETQEGTVARLVLRDGKPLTPEEDSAERGRLQYQLDSPSSFAHHIKNEQSNKKMGVDLLKLMPDAMLWSFAPGESSVPEHAAGSSAGPLVVLDFKPNPHWNPPTLASEALTGLAGRIWIEADTHQMVHLEGSLIKPVNVGWGMVAHLYPGGTVSLHQSRAVGDRWIVDHIVEQLNVRALMVKTIRQRLIYDTSSYQPVPGMTYQQAIKLLLDTPLPTR